MERSGPAIFYDGTTSARHQVTVELDTDALVIRAADASELARWPYDQLEPLAAPANLLRIGRYRSPVLARLEITDPALAHAVDERSLPIDRSGKGERRSRRRVVFWSIGATISLVCVAVFGVPLLADQATPLIPVKVEQKLGATVDVQIRSMLDNGPRGSVFECGLADADNEARAAFGRLIARLEPAAGLPIPLKVAVVRRKEANAITLPGGYVYVFEGLIKESKNVDELAGVIAHEIGHVANRDSTRSVLNAAGLSFLFGMLLGDFVGGGAVILGARALLQSSYSRDVEGKADLYAVDLMTKVGGDPGALGAILERIGGATEYGMRVLLDHPETKQRVALIKAAMKQPAGSPLLDDAGWAALKRICGGA